MSSLGDEKRRGICRIGPTALARILNLPAEHRIVGVRISADEFDVVEILLEGPTLPLTREGTMTPRVTLEMSIDGTGLQYTTIK